MITIRWAYNWSGTTRDGDDGPRWLHLHGPSQDVLVVMDTLEEHGRKLGELRDLTTDRLVPDVRTRANRDLPAWLCLVLEADDRHVVHDAVALVCGKVKRDGVRYRHRGGQVHRTDAWRCP